MLIAILIISIFNTGLIILMSCGLMGALRQEMIRTVTAGTKHTDESIEALGTAVFNMDSLKQKVEMSGEVEV